MGWGLAAHRGKPAGNREARSMVGRYRDGATAPIPTRKDDDTMFSVRLARKLLTATAALVMITTAAGTAEAATGTFTVNDFPVLIDPEDDTCHEVSWEAGDELSNDTDTTARIYSEPGCDEANFLGVIRSGDYAPTKYSRRAGVLFDFRS
jgi:hypothetical protein